MGYLAASTLQREAAALLTQRTGVTWTPREIQETIWSFAKTAYEGVYSPGPGREALAPRVTQANAQGRASHDMICSTPDFELLFLEGAYRTFLEAAGYGDQLRTVERSVAGRTSAGGARLAEGGPTAPEGSGFGADQFSELLQRAGQRLDELATRRQRGSQYTALRADVAGGRPDAFPAAAYSRAGGGDAEAHLTFPRLGSLEQGDVVDVHLAADNFLEGQRRPGANPPTQMRELAPNERAAALFTAVALRYDAVMSLSKTERANLARYREVARTAHRAPRITPEALGFAPQSADPAQLPAPVATKQGGRRGVGRPRKGGDGEKERLLHLLADGETLREAAAAVGVSLATLWRWVDQEQSFERAFSRAREAGYRVRIDDAVRTAKAARTKDEAYCAKVVADVVLKTLELSQRSAQLNVHVDGAIGPVSITWAVGPEHGARTVIEGEASKS